MTVEEHYEHALRVLEYERIREVLTSYAASALGRGLASRLEPLRDAERLRALHAETREMCELIRGRRLPLSGLSDVSSGIREIRSQGRPAEPDFLYRVLELIRAGLALRGVLEQDAELYPHLARLARGLIDIPELREEIPRVVEPGGRVLDTASERLGEVRRRVKDLRDSLRRRSSEVLRRSSLRRCFQAEGVTIKADRYVLPVKAEFRSWLRGPIRDRSHSGATLYVEPQDLVSDGDRLVDCLEEERAEEIRILWDVTRNVLDRRREIDRLQRRLARVDFTYAKSSWMAAFDLDTPEIVDDGRLELREARHPYLMWLARDSSRGLRDLDLDSVLARVVPLDMRVEPERRIVIVTGPNTGGKTVALKTIGLNVLLALSGAPIASRPGSRVPVYVDVFADIGDEQSIEQNLSTFSSHLRQVATVLRHATAQSLVLLDEFGSGTDPLEGAALGKALLDGFRERQVAAVITTHLGSLKQYAYLHDEVENAAMEFDPRTLEPTYRLLLGIPGSSNALVIARKLGLDGEIVDRAEAEISAVEAPTREIISRMERSRRRTEKERRRAERVRRRVQREAREYEEKIEAVEARKDALDREAEDETDRVVRQAREELRALVLALRNVPQSHREAVGRLEEAIDRLLVSTPLGERREAFARGLRKGDEVFVPKFRARGTVRKINKGDRVLTVLLDGLAAEIGFDDVSWLEEPPRPSAESSDDARG